MVVMNNLVKSLADDTAHLKQFARFMKALTVSTYGPLCAFRGCRGDLQLCYRGENGGAKEITLFLYENNGNDLFYTRDCTPDLFGLPVEVSQKIYKEVLCPPGGIVIDLDSGTRTGIDLALSMISTPFWNLKPKLIFLEENRFIFRMASCELVVPPSKFQQLREVVCRKRESQLWVYPWHPRFRPNHGPMQLEMKFHLDPGYTLADVRIRVKNLLLLTSTLNSRAFKLDASLICSEGTTVEQHTTSLFSLQARVLEFIRQTIPTDLQYSASAMDLKINGLGEVKSMEIWTANSRRIFDDSAFIRQVTVERVVAQYGVAASQVTVAVPYDGSLENWIRFVEKTIVEDMEVNAENYLYYSPLHLKYFGNPTPDSKPCAGILRRWMDL